LAGIRKVKALCGEPGFSVGGRIRGKCRDPEAGDDHAFDVGGFLEPSLIGHKGNFANFRNACEATWQVAKLYGDGLQSGEFEIYDCVEEVAFVSSFNNGEGGFRPSFISVSPTLPLIFSRTKPPAS